MAETPSLMNALISSDARLKKGRTDFPTAMQKMGFTSVFDIVRLPKSAFARQLARYSDANADVAYDNAMKYAALISRLFREYQTSSGTFQQLAQRSGIRALVPLGATYQRMFNENWDEFTKVGAIAANDSPVAYLTHLRKFSLELEETSEDPKRLLMDKRRPDLKDLLITHESTFTPRPMLEIVMQVLESHLRSHLDGNPSDQPKSTHQVLAERRYPFVLPYNFYHHQCQLGLADKKPRLGEVNYRASLLLPIKETAINDYGQIQHPALQAQRLLCGLSPQQQELLIEPSVFSDFYLTRNDLINGWKSPLSAYLRPHTTQSRCYLLLSGQADATASPVADTPTGSAGAKTVVSLIFRKNAETQPASIDLSSNLQNLSGTGWLVNRLHDTGNSIIAHFKAATSFPTPTEQGYTARFDLITATGTAAEPIHLARQRFAFTLDDHYSLTTTEQNFLKSAYGVEVTDDSPLWQLTLLTDFMQHTGLNAEQVEQLVARRSYAVRVSPNCPNLQPNPNRIASRGATNKVLEFPYPTHYAACYVNGTGPGTDLYDSELEPAPEAVPRDDSDTAIGLEQIESGDSKQWRLSKTSLDRLDRLQRMIRLQRWTGITFAKLDTLIISAIRAEGEANLGLELNENTLRALGVYRYLNQRYSIEPEEFATLMHDLSPYASGKDEVPLFDRVFNRVQLFDTPLILDDTPINLTTPDAATQKTLLQLCAGLGVQPTEDSLLLIVRQTEKHVGELKRDLPTVSSLYRQARIARLFGHSVEDLLALAGLLGGSSYKTALASGRLSAQTAKATPDILDVLMQLDWAFDWLNDSQQTVPQLLQRLGLNAQSKVEELPSDQHVKMAGEAPLPDDLLARLARLQNDTRQSLVTEAQVNALGLPLQNDGKRKQGAINWFQLLVEHSLLNPDGLLTGLDRPLTLVDEPVTWLQTDVVNALKDLDLNQPVKDACAEKLVEFLLGAHDRQARLLEGLFQETAKLAPDRCRAVTDWAWSTPYNLLLQALKDPLSQTLIEDYRRVARHAEIVVQLRLSNSALRLFLVNPAWLAGESYGGSNSEPSLSDVYLLERFSHWFHGQSQSEDSVLSYFSCANPAKAQLKNKALRQLASETANAALARLLEWSETEIAELTNTLPDKRARSMAHVDWIRRCQATCQASGLSAQALLQATGLNHTSTLNEWKAVGEAVMATHSDSDASRANG
ncbi:hypothetical protein FGA82_24805 [Pseudomonas fluorescens]|uniref:Tc toxin subunit A n=1 Tax=Pseudomonas fluorescens TaxID=294 RepID=UPI001130A0FA|nr:Tc toxin subunit A [Pseudomonas fluorescens]TMU72201.1 hypothetical protein FGA82_24805 [Pseudomonas fluorescens]